MFTGITLITLTVTSFLSYYNQNKLYKEQKEESIHFVASYLEELLVADDIYFIWYQDYFLKEAGSLLIPHNFDEASVQNARFEYEEVLSTDYAGLVLGSDLTFDDLSPKAKTAYEVYSHEYYQQAFEKAQEQFNLSYIYYLVPDDDGTDNATFVLDSVRKELIIDGNKFIKLGTKVNYPKSEHERLWEAWEKEIQPSGNDVFNNERGKYYVYYTPVFVQNRKMGIIGIEVDVASVTKEIIDATLRQVIMIAAVLVFFMGILLAIIRKIYVKKMVILQKTIDEYTMTKDPKLAQKLKAEVTNEDEISTIMSKFADLVQVLDTYMNNLTVANERLEATQQKNMEMSILAMKDPLTGIRNKTGYDREIQRLKHEMDEGVISFGIAMIDLNYLKKINDTYGHDKGNIAIVNLSKIVCSVFEHSPVFRIGGDEFVVILRGNDLDNIENLVTDFNGKIQSLQQQDGLEYWEKVSAAIGYAIYDVEIDFTYEELFKRADADMYKNKKAMKAERME